MSFANAGSLIAQTASSFTLTPAGAGNLIVLVIINRDNSSVTVTGVSSSNVTWVQAGTSFAGSTNAMTASTWLGTVTAASAATVTISWSGTTPTARVAGREFSSTAGSWALDAQSGLDSGGTNAWPSLPPSAGAGDLYLGFAIDSGSASAGSTTGYTYQSTPQGNGVAYNPACGAGATGPTWGDSGQAFGQMVLVRETGAAAASPPGTLLAPPGRQSPLAFRFLAPAASPVPSAYVSSSDSGSAAESSSTALASADTAAAAESSSTALSSGDTGGAAESSSTAVASADTASAAESSSTALSDPDTGSAAESSSTALSSGDTGTGADAGTATAPAGPPGAPLIPPGRRSPAAFRFRAPTPPVPAAVAYVADSDSGTAREGELIEIPPPPAPQGGWWQYLEICRYREQERQFWAANPPMSCPRCGEPLTNAPPTDSGSSVELFCRFDGWEFPGDWRPPI